MSSLPEGAVACGKFLKPFGIEGESKFNPYLPDDIDPAKLKSGYLVPPTDKNGKKIDILSVRKVGTLWIIKPDGINSPEEASKITHSELWVERSLIGTLPEGQYLHQDLIGCAVFDEKENRLGEISDILQTGANDVWEIKRDDGSEILIPAIKDVIRSIDIKNKKVVVRLLEGLGD